MLTSGSATSAGRFGFQWCCRPGSDSVFNVARLVKVSGRNPMEVPVEVQPGIRSYAEAR